MAFPARIQTTGDGSASSQTSHTLTYPSGISAGDRLIAVFFVRSSLSSNATFPGSWVEFVNGSGQFSLSAAYLDCDGTESGTFTVTSSVTGGSAWRIFHLDAGTFNAGQAPEAGVESSGSSDSPNPDPVTPSWGAVDTLYIACAAHNSTSPGETTSGYPSNYSEGGEATGVGTTTTSRLATAVRELAATSDNPGAFTLTGSETWRGLTIAVLGAYATAEATLSQTLADVTVAGTAEAPAEAALSQTLEAATLSATAELDVAFDATTNRFMQGRQWKWREYRQPGGRRR